MGLPKIIKIPCHHVLTNQKALKFKKGEPLKQIFNINLGIGIIKKLFFCLYFRHISLCFYSNFDRESSLDAELHFTSNEYPLGILLIDPATPKTRNTWKNVMMMWNQILHPTSSPNRNLSKNTMRYVENTNKKKFSFMTNMSIQPLWLNHFIEILLVLEFQLTRTYCWHVFL